MALVMYPDEVGSADEDELDSAGILSAVAFR